MFFEISLSPEKHGWIIQGAISLGNRTFRSQHSSDYAIANRSGLRKASAISIIVWSVTEVVMNMTFAIGMENATVKKMTNLRKL
jgi:hypothetical protein